MNANNSEGAVKEKIMEFAKKYPKGVSDKEMKAAMPDLSNVDIVAAINKLLQQGCLDLYNNEGSLIYK